LTALSVISSWVPVAMAARRELCLRTNTGGDASATELPRRRGASVMAEGAGAGGTGADGDGAAGGEKQGSTNGELSVGAGAVADDASAEAVNSWASRVAKPNTWAADEACEGEQLLLFTGGGRDAGGGYSR
jgi:hypothetical protein